LIKVGRDLNYLMYSYIGRKFIIKNNSFEEVLRVQRKKKNWKDIKGWFNIT